MGPWQWVLIALIIALLIAYPIVMFYKNKKDTEKVKFQSENLKKGDKVLTTSGIYGTIVEVRQEGNGRIITIETGSEKNKGYISMDAFAIYTVLSDILPDDEKVEDKISQIKEAAPLVAEASAKPETKKVRTASSAKKTADKAINKTKNK